MQVRLPSLAWAEVASQIFKTTEILVTCLQGKEKPAMVLELNISMEAPNITMPRSSNSKDAIEVDLGSLRLGNAVAWRNGNSMKIPEVSMQELKEHI